MFERFFVIVTGLCEISIWWMIYQDRRKATGKNEIEMPSKRWIVLVLLSLGPLVAFGVNYYAGSKNQKIPEFDAPQEGGLVRGWGQDSSHSCAMVENGKQLLSGRVVISSRSDALSTMGHRMSWTPPMCKWAICTISKKEIYGSSLPGMIASINIY